MTDNSRAIKVIVVCITLAALLAWAGSEGSVPWLGVPLFAVCVFIAFVMQWIGFVPSYLNQTEHFYDLTGSLTYLSIIIFVLLVRDGLDARSQLLAAMVMIWAARLGSFLFMRITKDGSDHRFDEIKPDPVRFFAVWTLQGLWVSITAAAALAAMLATDSQPLGWFAMVGIALWLLGFSLEVIADRQKRVFRATRAQTGHQFIHTGLWAYSRHPNYFGEIVLWIGVSLIAWPVLSGWGYATLISPLFVTLLLTRVSGIPTLEQSADRKFEGNHLYDAYKAQTPVLVPRLTKPAVLQESQVTGQEPA
ncbi:DUF1295 domain-containing protein [Pseudomaricurvus alkylphenolicus]|uniref:DUF1295 domain-containing protein n=1 Tax=Pseudomaricurvus alkylphenolicus TaxID=1306991 RepID=UPI00141E7F9A|nr:DUF1295 domain-containing protein [Pseudomaricurvus alkylphenolicus]